MFILNTDGRCGCTFSQSRMDADRGGGSMAVSGSSLFTLCAIKRGGSSLYSPNLPQSAHRSLLAIFGVTMMQTPHPSADVPAYKQSPRKTRIDSGCWIHGWQHCLSLHLPLSLSSVQVELCAYWTCKCFSDPITKSAGKKFCGLLC